MKKMIIALAVFTFGCSPFTQKSNQDSYEVPRVIDGRTIEVKEVKKDDSSVVVQLANIEIDANNENEAKAFNEKKFNEAGHTIKLITDLALQSQVKHPGVLVAYVILSDGHVLNDELINSGLGSADQYLKAIAEIGEKKVKHLKQEIKEKVEMIKR